MALTSIESTPHPAYSIDDPAEIVAFLREHGGGDFVLFRGQPCTGPLVPRIGRLRSRYDGNVREAEQRMIEAFKRQAPAHLRTLPRNDWEWLALAQHHGMATRFLDWTTNPLAALWFAVSDPATGGMEAVLWVLRPKDDWLVKDANAAEGPTAITNVRLFYPPHISRRIRSQNGAFTVHPSTGPKGVIAPFEHDSSATGCLAKLAIGAGQRNPTRDWLNRCGVNWSALMPDVDGLARHVTWAHTLLEDEP